jgi:L-aspartate oxidase
VIGSGIAGLTYALKAARRGEVLILTKKASADSSTNFAQGGVASVMDPADRFELHVEDTLKSGAGLCRREAVEIVVRSGPALVRELLDLGVEFSRGGAVLDLGREGGHSQRRIVHAKDHTGREIERALLAAVAANPKIRVLENHFTLDLWISRGRKGEPSRCHGVLYFVPETGEIGLARARATLLATGGLGKVYLYTTNPDIATADGVAMAARAGCSIVNLEFVQFHPTCLYHPEAKSFLITEAIRGEGGVLRNLAGEDFMRGRHELGSLATRDIVAREIDREMKARGDKYVLLDVSQIGKSRFLERFPSISERLRSFGLRPGVDPIPVVPAAHYMCGGVAVDLDGRTEIEGLHAAGEVACTGVHGANRLASNSLLEALVLADRAANSDLPADRDGLPEDLALPGSEPRGADEGVILDHEWDAVRRLLWDYVGLVRTCERLDHAITRVALMREWSEDLYSRRQPSRDLAELRNIALVGEILARTARSREESRGLHFITDFPELSAVARESWAKFEGGSIVVSQRELPGG